MAWYRFRVTFRRRWPGYLALAVLIGLVGGVALGSVTAARRTDASYPKFLASTNPSDLVVQPFTRTNYSPGFLRQLARLPHVTGVAAAVPLTAATLTPAGNLGTVLLAHVQLAGTLAGAGGLYSAQDRMTIVAGRRADPAHPDEVVATPVAVALLHLHVGSQVRVGLIGTSTVYRRVDLTVVGIGVLNTQVLQDSIDSGRTGFLVGTPALTREFASCCASSHELVLGPATLAQLRQRVGRTVTLASGSFHVRLKIAGTATMPAIGSVLTVHTSMSTGALFSTAILPSGAGSSPFGPLLSGPNAILIRLRPGVSQAAGLRSMQAISRQLTGTLNSPRVEAASGGLSVADTVDLLGAQRPAEIVNYRTMGAMPAVLAGGLAAGAVAALGLTLVASVRRRRRDFALLKTLGFTRGQLAGAVAWQSSAIALTGLVIGVPVGIAAGRWLWLAFANQLSAVPDPVVPAASIGLAALAALVLANLVAALPGRAAARTRAGLLLRAE